MFARPRALTAAATKADEQQTRNERRLHQPWQARAFRFYNTVGECWSPAQFTARALSKTRLYAATGDPDNPEELEAGWAVDLVKQWQAIPEPYGRLRTLIGEGRLTHSLMPDAKPGELPQWEFLSPTELTLAEDGAKIRRDTGGDPVEYVNISDDPDAGEPEAGQMRMWRFWRPHPERSMMADSAFRGVLELFEQLWWLTMSERADLRNRSANQGLLLIPKEIVFEEAMGAEEEAREGEDENVDPFQRMIQELLTAALTDPGSAAAASPGVIRAPAEFLTPEVFRHLQFYDPSASLYQSGREEALLKRISIDLNMPAEAMTGLGGLNHWNAWKLDDEKFQYVEPEGKALVTDLTEVVLRPFGRANQKPDADEVFVAIDWAELVSDPDKGKTAIQLRGMGLISAEATRAANDFEESTAIGEDEYADYLAIQLRDPSLVGTLDVPAEVPEQNQEPPPESASPEAPAEESPAGQASATGNGHHELRERIVVAAHHEARASAGRWILGKRRSCPECVERLVDLPSDQIIASLSGEDVTRLGESREKLAARMRDRFYTITGSLGLDLPVQHAARVEAWFDSTLQLERPDPRDLLTLLED